MSEKAMIRVTLKEEVLDPQGKAVLSVLKSSGYNNIKDVRVGKYIELYVDSDNSSVSSEIKAEPDAGKNAKMELSDEIREISEKILSNPLIEEFSITIK